MDTVSVNINLCVFCMWSIAIHQKMQECCFVLHFIYILQKILRDCSVKLLAFEKENPATEKISKI